MSVELRPLGVACNLACAYCYQNPQRDAGNHRRSYDLERIKEAAAHESGPFTLFGGEPLLLPLADLEDLLSWGFETHGTSAIQTNGVLLTDAHVDLFRKYNVRVGISIDGPGRLNDARRIGTRARTRDATAAVQAAIRTLCEKHEPPGLIVTLHRGNATPAKLPRMHRWVRQLDALGIKTARLHVLESESAAIRALWALDDEQTLTALMSFADLEAGLVNLRFDIFRDIDSLLLSNGGDSSCVWHACDPYTTAAVRGVEGNGESSNCGRTNKDGIDHIKAGNPGYERYIALYHTPQEHGGCRGCRFFLFCKGQCPGTAIDGDWRYRTEHCGVWKAMFAAREQLLVDRGEQPISRRSDIRRLEGMALAAWAEGRNTSIDLLVKSADRSGDPQR